VSVINLATNVVIVTIGVGAYPYGVAVNPKAGLVIGPCSSPSRLRR
jgi:DNA-binding beta-propeller fold protein YncE